MSFIRLALCVAGVYSMFLLWAIAQERLSVPFESVVPEEPPAKLSSSLIMSLCQSILSSIAAFAYIMTRKKPEETLLQAVGLEPSKKLLEEEAKQEEKHKLQTNGHAQANGNGHVANGHYLVDAHKRFDRQALLLRYLQTSLFITAAAPLGFAALSYISYPAMVLGKSCKLVPVMVMNVLLYRRKFAPHKYLVVFMVTTGITVFMGLKGNSKHTAKSGNNLKDTPYANVIGISYLLINLGLDGAINSTQDEIFARYKVTGQQMMLWINLFCTAISMVLAVLPLPEIPIIHPSAGGTSELGSVLAFVRTHPSIVLPLAEFAVTGALGQLFIFETLQHFGSLTLVTVTLTRKLFTMVLSVIVYKHKLTPGQWLGAAIVFAGISVEALVKRRDIHAKRVIQEKEKAKIKSL